MIKKEESYFRCIPMRFDNNQITAIDYLDGHLYIGDKNGNVFKQKLIKNRNGYCETQS